MTYTPINNKLFDNKYFVSRIPYEEAIKIAIEKHYMHRKMPCSKAYGLIYNNEIKGICTYGVPVSSTLLKGVCGIEEYFNIYELNRLWVDEDVPKNGESFLIGNSIKDLDREIIISFSDTSVGHIGYIYQATNFLYCGLSSKFKDIRVKGKENQHTATFAHGLTFKEVEQKIW